MLSGHAALERATLCQRRPVGPWNSERQDAADLTDLCIQAELQGKHSHRAFKAQ
jgi:hypothetical protein